MGDEETHYGDDEEEGFHMRVTTTVPRLGA
jgi:hypothetical protein